MHRNNNSVTSIDLPNTNYQCRATPIWMVWTIFCGELLFLAGGAFALNCYWLMLPVWMRSIATGSLIGLSLLLIFRLVRYFRLK